MPGVGRGPCNRLTDEKRRDTVRHSHFERTSGADGRNHTLDEFTILPRDVSAQRHGVPTVTHRLRSIDVVENVGRVRTFYECCIAHISPARSVYFNAGAWTEAVNATSATPRQVSRSSTLNIAAGQRRETNVWVG